MTKKDISQNKKVSTLSHVSEKTTVRKIANFSQLSTSKELPSVADTLLELLNPSGGTVLEFSEKDIQFHNPLSPVKSLHVAICSSEQEDISVLHKIHLMTRI